MKVSEGKPVSLPGGTVDRVSVTFGFITKFYEPVYFSATVCFHPQYVRCHYNKRRPLKHIIKYAYVYGKYSWAPLTVQELSYKQNLFRLIRVSQERLAMQNNWEAGLL